MNTLGFVYMWLSFALAAHNLFHLWALRTAPGHRWFGLFMPVRMVLALHAIGTTAFYLGPPALRGPVQVWQSVTFSLSALVMTWATGRLVGHRRAWLRLSAGLLACVVIGAGVGGMGASGQPLSLFSGLLLWLAWVPFIVASVRLVQKLGLQLAPGLAGLLASVGGLHDVAVRMGLLSTPLLLDFISLFTAVAVAGRLGASVSSARAAAAEQQATLEGNLRELEASRRELERQRALAQSGELAAIVAHEVRNPLAIIRNVGSRLSDPGRSQAERAPLLSIVHEEVARLEALVEDLSRFATPLAPACRPVQLAPLLESAAERERSARTGASALQIEVQADPQLPLVQADPELLLMAIGNLTSNAAHALPKGGRIQLRAMCGPDGTVVVSVADSGGGMPAEVLSQARQAFFTTRASGTGLGLTIVDRVATAHDGHMDIHSDTGGTTVSLTLPIAGPLRLAS